MAAGAVNDVPDLPGRPTCAAACSTCASSASGASRLSPRAGQNLFDLDLPARPALVLGGETGLRPLVEQTCDLQAAIPLRAGVESLNASVAGAVAMYEVAAPARSP